jgi:hypothetical protein
MRIGLASLQALRAISATRARGESVTIFCTVEGGLACRASDGPWDDPQFATFLQALVQDLGYKTIEHASRRQVTIRFQPAAAECQIDLGDGFIPVEVAHG